MGTDRFKRIMTGVGFQSSLERALDAQRALEKLMKGAEVVHGRFAEYRLGIYIPFPESMILVVRPYPVRIEVAR